MHRCLAARVIVPAALAWSVAACGSSPPPQTAHTTIYVQPPPTPAPPPAVMVSPQPPPPPQSELVPPPPSPDFVWQPGHWRYTGIAGRDWDWVGGVYVRRPPGQAEWELGHWQTAQNGWVWVEGHWR
jgi:hypothetical protein